MKDFPLLLQLNIKLSANFYLCALQREFDRLGEIIDLVHLRNVIARNNKVHARITVPKSSSWKSFLSAVKK